MTSEQFATVISLAAPIVAGAAAGVWWAIARNANRWSDRWREELTVALDVLDLMERAHDPGREVHERLAFALESGLVRDAGDGKRSDPAGRRAAAMTLAASMIDAIGRANLELTTKAAPDD